PDVLPGSAAARHLDVAQSGPGRLRGVPGGGQDVLDQPRPAVDQLPDFGRLIADAHDVDTVEVGVGAAVPEGAGVEGGLDDARRLAGGHLADIGAIRVEDRVGDADTLVDGNVGTVGLVGVRHDTLRADHIAPVAQHRGAAVVGV